MKLPAHPSGLYVVDEHTREALCLEVSERLAGDRVNDRDVGGPVAGHQLADLGAVGAVVGDGTPEEPNCCEGFLVVEHLDVGEPGGVVDTTDVHIFPADPFAAPGPVDSRSLCGSRAGCR